MGIRLTGISSMATRQVLAELAAAYRAASGVERRFESVGGVDAAKRVAAGEAFDVVILAADAIDKLIAGGSVLADSRVDLVRSPVAIACAKGAPRPTSSSEAALRRAVLAAQHWLFHRAQRHGPAASLHAGASPSNCANASSRPRPACRWRNWWPMARSNSASSN
jgi:ABC-type molybdate transport system substrate-binding protein